MVPSLSHRFMRRCTSFASKNYFEIFDLPPAYAIDSTTLRHRWKDLQTKHHPDKQASQPGSNATTSSLINTAYNTLTDSLRRAHYLLELHGHAIDESEAMDDPQFLGQMLELNELVEETENEAEVRQINDVNDQQIEEIETELCRHFDAEDYGAARVHVIRLRYYVALRRQIRARLGHHE